MIRVKINDTLKDLITDAFIEGRQIASSTPIDDENDAEQYIKDLFPEKDKESQNEN